MVNQNLLLLAYIVPIGLGTLLMTKRDKALERRFQDASHC